MALTPTISQQLARFVELQPASNTGRRGAEAMVAAAVTMGVLYLAFGAQAALVGVSGAFVAFTGWDRPLWSRAKILGQLGVVYLAAVAAGVAVAGSGVLSVLVLGVVGLVVSFWYHAVIGDPPGPMLLIAGAGFATWSEALTVNGLPYLLLVIAGMTVSSAVCLLFQLPQRQLPLREAMEAVTEAVDALVAANPVTTDPKALARLRDEAFAAHFHAQEVLVDSTARDHPTTHRARLDRALHSLHVQLIEAVCRHELPWARVEVQELLKLPYLGTPDTRYLLRWAMSGASLPWLAARRMGVAILLTGAVVLASGSTQPHWAVMTTAIVLSGGVDRVTTTHRAAHRLAGTVAGLLLFLLIESRDPTPPVVLGIVLCCVFLTQVLGPRNFALASAAITPMALLMFTIGHPLPAQEVVTTRLLETAVGAGSAVLVLWLSGFSTPIALVRRQFRRTLRTLERTLDLYTAGWGRTPLGFAARRNLHFEQLACVRILDLALADRPRTLAHWPQLEADVSTLTHVVLTAGWTEEPAQTLDTAAMAGRLRNYLAGLPPISGLPIDADRAHRELTAVLAAGRAGRR